MFFLFVNAITDFNMKKDHYFNTMKKEETFLRENARIKWLQEGDNDIAFNQRASNFQLKLQSGELTSDKFII